MARNKLDYHHRQEGTKETCCLHPFPPQSNREAFSLRNDLQSDKSNRFTVTAWKGPARTLLVLMWPDLKPFSYSPFLCHLPFSPPTCSRGQQRMRLAQWRQATSLFSSPPCSTRAPFKREGKALLCGSYLLKATEPPDKDLVTDNLWHGLNGDTFVHF